MSTTAASAAVAADVVLCGRWRLRFELTDPAVQREQCLVDWLVICAVMESTATSSWSSDATSLSLAGPADTETAAA